MAVDFTIRSIDDTRDLKRLRAFIITQALRYPRHEEWIDKVCIPELESGWKSAIVAWSDGKVIGDAIYQPHKQLPRTRELKNLRINPAYRRRDLAHFLIRQVEEEDNAGFDRILLDAQQPDVVQWLRFCGYRTVANMPLYDPNVVDTIMVKEFKPDYSSPFHL